MAKKKVCFLPWRAEFGTLIMCYVRWIHGFPADEKVVCCRKGDEPLFPSARAFIYGWNEVADAERNTALLASRGHWDYLRALAAKLSERLPGYEMVAPPLDPKTFYYEEVHPEWNFKPQPLAQSVAHLDPGDCAEVLLAPRGRQFAAFRNYQHWEGVAQGLRAAGLRLGLLGVKDSTQDLPGIREQDKAWSHADNLSWTLWAMNHARLTVSIDSAMAHLAVLNGTPLKIICDRPGELPRTRWKWTVPHMQGHATAHCAPIFYAWDDPQVTVDAVLAYLRGA